MRLIILIPTVLATASLLVAGKNEVDFASEAKLLVRKAVELPGEIAAVVTAEAAKFKSPELSRQVAMEIGPEKILGRAAVGEQDNAKAASTIQEGLQVSTRKGSPVISLRFQHADPAIIQRVLDHLIKARFEQLLKMEREEMERPNDADTKKNVSEPALVNLSVIQRPSEPRRIEGDQSVQSLRQRGKQKAEPGGADQPATAPESKSEGK